MMNSGKKGSVALKLILLSLMLAMQSLSFAHELSHYQAPDAEYCPVCSGQPGSEALVQAETVGQAVRHPHFLAAGQPAEDIGEGRWPDWQSRAPPAHP